MGVQKRDKSLRICVDFKVHVNKAIKSDAYPLPAMETIFAGLCGATDFARLDLKDAYWQIPLDKQSRELCTINTLKGLYHMTRLPKGLKNSSAIFQRVMETILKDLPGVIIYQDDILIHAPSSDLLAKRLSSVISQLQQKNVTVNQVKSVMLAKEVKFLGHLVSANGIKPDPAIATKILSCKPPRDRAELESFLGLVNFFGRMIPNFEKMVAPLHQLRRSGTPFVWTSAHQKAFDCTLSQLAKPPLLQAYSLTEEATVTTDASETTTAGVLTQRRTPVMYVSCVLTLAERNYSNFEREGLAVVWSLLRMRQLLVGRKFTLVTDR